MFNTKRINEIDEDLNEVADVAFSTEERVNAMHTVLKIYQDEIEKLILNVKSLNDKIEVLTGEIMWKQDKSNRYKTKKNK